MRFPTRLALTIGALSAVLLPALAAQLVWEDRTPPVPAAPTPRWGLALAFDAARQRAVLFGGARAVYAMDDTWEWDGARWGQRSPANAPPPRVGHALAYDSVRQRIVLFGGSDLRIVPTTLFDDTWEWDGSSWTLHTPAHRPTARSEHAMAYDAARGRVVLFGGADAATGRLGDTWEWDGVDWVQRAPAASPSARLYHAMAYDAARSRTVLFGGDPSPNTADTWEWDGNSWTLRSPVTRPSARIEHAMAYDAARGRVVLFGGGGGNTYGETVFTDTWEWDGTDWSRRIAAHEPHVAAVAVAMAYDAARQRTVLLGVSETRSITFEWDGNDWTEPAPWTSPVDRGGHALAYDAVNRDVLWAQAGETWAWDGNLWRRRAARWAPGDHGRHAMASDTLRGRVVLFGGSGTAGITDETWEWDGNAWTRLAPAPSPAPRQSHAMAFDAIRQTTVLFGGASTQGVAQDTWEWDGTVWRQRFPVAGPSPRFSHALAFDERRGVTVLYGGESTGPAYLSDTWEWDGANWTRRLPAHDPGPRTGHGMAYDAARGRTVLFGGSTTNRADTWEWDGHDWVETTPAATPRARVLGAMAYDRQRQRAVLFGGAQSLGTALSDTWEYRPKNRAAATPYGAGCAGSLGVPTLRAVGAPIVGNRDFAMRVANARAQSAVVVALAGGPANLPLPGGCRFLLQSPVIEVSGRTGASAVDLPVPVPRSAALSGVVLFAQGFVADPNGAFASLAAATAGLRVAVGD